MNREAMMAIRYWMAGACVALAAAPVAALDSDMARYVEEARGAAAGMQQQLAGKLLAEISASGPEGAVGVCRTLAPNTAAELSAKRGWKISRVSLRPRNPALGFPDAWEQKVLLDFDQRVARGEKPDALEHGETVEEPAGRYFRYMKALPVQPLCISCHGPADQLASGIKARLAADYPFDKATGYSVGQLRGAITVKRPLP